jgi:hypothetical protein
MPKETAAMAFIAVYWEGFASKLRNSDSRREIFRKGDEYVEIFSWGEDQPEASRRPAANVRERAVQFLAAAEIEQAIRVKIVDSKGDRKRRGALRKAAYFLARSAYLKNESAISKLITELIAGQFNQESTKEFAGATRALAEKNYPDAVKAFDQTMQAYLKAEGGDEDAALKNTKFALQLEKAIKGKQAETL